MGVTKVKGIDVRDGSITEADIVLSLTETTLDVSDEFVVKDSTSGLLKRATVSVVETYLNTKYQAKSSDLAAIAAIAGTSGLLKKTAAGAWSLDTNTYLTAVTKAQVESVLSGAIASHTHSYLPLSGGTMDNTNLVANLNSQYFGGQGLKQNQWFNSLRDFTLGTLIQTSIDYSVSGSDAWLLEIRGNSYTSFLPFDITAQGYMYNNTMLSMSGISNGEQVNGIVLFNYGGKLCFWFPTQGYWQGFSVFVSAVTATGYKTNAIVSITNEAKPAAISKEFSVSSTVKQSYHSGNFTPANYATAGQVHYVGTTSIAANRASAVQTLTGVSIDGNAVTVGNKGLANILAGKGDMLSNSNLNLVYETGMYYNQTGNGTGNSNWPDAYGVLNVFSNVNQTYYGNVQQHFGIDGTQKIRMLWGATPGTWGAWRTVWDSGNFTPSNYALSSNIGNGTLTLAVSGSGLSGSQSFTANQAGNVTFTVNSNATTLATGDTIALRTTSGYLNATYFNASCATEDGYSTSSYIFSSGTDGYFRKKSLVAVKTDIVTKAAVEVALTGPITTHTHEKLLGTITTDFNLPITLPRCTLWYNTSYLTGSNLTPGAVDNSNGVLTLVGYNDGTDLYGKQIGFGDSEDLYIRKIWNSVYGTWRKLYHNGNFISGTDYAPAHTHPYRSDTKPVSGAWWNSTPFIAPADGVMEIGIYLDFHISSTSTADYDYRLQAGSGIMSTSGALSVNGYVSATGGNSTNWNTAYGWGNHSGLYLPIGGGAMSGGGTIYSHGDIVPQQGAIGGSATGFFWKNIADTATISGIGCLTTDGALSGCYMGWGATPWDSATSLYVNTTAAYYKNNIIYHAGNFNPANYAAVGQVHYVGTTNIAANRASAAQTLTGVSIDGNAVTVGSKGISNIWASKDQLVSSSNLNLIYEIGTYLNTTGNGTGNSNWPDSYGVLNVFGYNNTQTYGNFQQHFSPDGTQRNRMLFTSTPGAWGPWRTIWDNGNFNPANYEPTIAILPVTKGGTGLGTIGTAQQWLRVNNAGTALEYATASTVPYTSHLGAIFHSGLYGFLPTWTTSMEVDTSERLVSPNGVITKNVLHLSPLGIVNWTTSVGSSGELEFKNASGVKKFSIDQSGNLVAAGTVTATNFILV